MSDYWIRDQNAQQGTDLSAMITIAPPAPGTNTGYVLEYRLLGPFVEGETHQFLTGFPTRDEAAVHGLRLFTSHVERVRTHPFFVGYHGRTRVSVAEYHLGDVEATAQIYWQGDDGWAWEIEYWWPGEKFEISNPLNYFDPVRAYVDLREKFLEIVKLVGGSAFDIETLASPFVEGEALPELPPPYQQAIVMTQDELDRMRAQVMVELAEHERRDKLRPQEEKETQDNGPDPGTDFEIQASTDPGHAHLRTTSRHSTDATDFKRDFPD